MSERNGIFWNDEHQRRGIVYLVEQADESLILHPSKWAIESERAREDRGRRLLMA